MSAGESARAGPTQPGRQEPHPQSQPLQSPNANNTIRPPLAPATETPSLTAVRQNALQTLSFCRWVNIDLELNRIRSSRAGRSRWLSFLEQRHQRPIIRALDQVISNTLAEVDELFRNVSSHILYITLQAEPAVGRAVTHGELLGVLEHVEVQVSSAQERRHEKTQSILNATRTGIDSIPARISDQFVDDMKRDIFCLDPDCDYHPEGGIPLDER